MVLADAEIGASSSAQSAIRASGHSRVPRKQNGRASRASVSGVARTLSPNPSRNQFTACSTMKSVGTEASLQQAVERLNAVRQEIAKVIVGQDDVVEGVLICLLGSGHVL